MPSQTQTKLDELCEEPHSPTAKTITRCRHGKYVYFSTRFNTRLTHVMRRGRLQRTGDLISELTRAELRACYEPFTLFVISPDFRIPSRSMLVICTSIHISGLSLLFSPKVVYVYVLNVDEIRVERHEINRHMMNLLTRR